MGTVVWLSPCLQSVPLLAAEICCCVAHPLCLAVLKSVQICAAFFFLQEDLREIRLGCNRPCCCNVSSCLCRALVVELKIAADPCSGAGRPDDLPSVASQSENPFSCFCSFRSDCLQPLLPAVPPQSTVRREIENRSSPFSSLSPEFRVNETGLYSLPTLAWMLCF